MHLNSLQQHGKEELCERLTRALTKAPLNLHFMLEIHRIEVGRVAKLLELIKISRTDSSAFAFLRIMWHHLDHEAPFQQTQTLTVGRDYTNKFEWIIYSQPQRGWRLLAFNIYDPRASVESLTTESWGLLIERKFYFSNEFSNSNWGIGDQSKWTFLVFCRNRLKSESKKSSDTMQAHEKFRKII